jgi:hypothetical protein
VTNSDGGELKGVPAVIKKALCALVLLAVMTSAAHAQQEKGDTELQFVASSLLVLGDDTTYFGNFSIKYGKFISDRIEFGVVPTVSITSFTNLVFDPVTMTFSSETDTEVTVGSGVFGTYSFLTEGARNVPYVGFQVYDQDLSVSDDPLGIGLNGGLKIFYTRNVALDVGGSYLFSSDDTASGMILMQMGLSVIF